MWPSACVPAARVMHEHEREQRKDLGFVGHESGKSPAQRSRLGGQIDPAAAPAFVEDQVHDGEDGSEPVGELVIGRHGEGDARVANLVLGPGQPLAHRLERDEEGECDLLGREAAEGAQGECHLCVEGEGRVAAREDQLEPFVGNDGGGRVVHRSLRDGLEVTREQLRLRGQHLLTADLVDGTVAGGRDEPADRAGRLSVTWPALRGDREGVGRRFLGQFDVAEYPGQRR